MDCVEVMHFYVQSNNSSHMQVFDEASRVDCVETMHFDEGLND